MLINKTADNSIRWQDGERLDHLFEQRCDELDQASRGKHEAIITEDVTLTFRDLDGRANQAARYLIEHGVRSGDRVGLLFDKSIETYVALLAVLKVNAAFVPFDRGFPNDRIGFILQDAGVKTILSESAFESKLADFDMPTIFLDRAKEEIDRKATSRLTVVEKGAPVSHIAYLIYTSGTTGNPKGVVIEHPSICNFVRVAAEVYGYGPEDRVYQGMTIAFDFSVEELWVPLLAGSALVPGKPGTSLVGNDLADYLLQHRVTGLACVPTLLATIEKDLPDLRLLIVSGEACPQNLVQRWHRPGRTILNAYGPTEATVTCTLTELEPDTPVTIGGPLPTYTIVILDPDKKEAVAVGELGEIGIAGIGLAQGYLNRLELTEQKFIPDFLNIENNPSKRIYRSGDLGRINENGEIEFHGRIDTQVKIRGYRIELTEIESILMQFPQIAQAVVDTYEPEPGAVELVAYYTLHDGEADLAHAEIAKALRSRLPGYMVPAYIEKLPLIPMTTSNKADRKNLPVPSGPRVAVGGASFVAPRNATEESLADTLAQVLQVDQVSIEDHFFHDLGAHSLLMARFCSAIRQNPSLPDISMPDIYLNPTIASLAAYLGSASADVALEMPREQLRIPSNFEYYGCGALQLLFYAGFGLLGLLALITGFEWTYAAIDNPLALYARIVAFSVAAFVGMTALAIAAKWLLIGKWRQETFPIWSLRYFRFWVVRTLVQNSPLALFAGTPLYNIYLRLLGAKIGPNAVIASGLVPVCTDLISIGRNAVIRKDAILQGYCARSNYIHTGSIKIGNHVYVGDAAVLDIDTVMEDHTQLGHASSLQSGQRVPLGLHYHGSPALETSADYCAIADVKCSAARRVIYSAFQLVTLFGLAAPIPVLFLYFGVPYFFPNSSGYGLDPLALDATALLALAQEMLIFSFVLLFGLLAVGSAAVYSVPRLCNLFLQKDKTYVLYGVHYFIQAIVSSFSNSPIFNLLFGDSALIVHYLRLAGYKLNKVDQTGANFGLDQLHDNPFLCDIGNGTMVSDGLTMINTEMSSTSFRLGEVKIGAHNYLGNNIYYPSAGKTGANCLLGTKVMVPIDGPVRENIGLLGSPCFEIPRAVERDKNFDPFLDKETRRRQIRKMTAYNVVTMLAYLLSNWLMLFIALMLAYFAIFSYPAHGVLSLALVGVLSLFAILFFVCLEWASLGFKRLEPKVVSIYDASFWSHERHWKFCGNPLPLLFKGTPFKNAISRMLGVRLGKKVFDDGGKLFDKTLIEVGDHANLNDACIIQGHSLEEGVFKSDHVKIGAGCTLGSASFVHYGVRMGDGVLLAPDSFLMKGEVLDPNTLWRGNPAKLVAGPTVAEAAPSEDAVQDTDRPCQTNTVPDPQETDAPAAATEIPVVADAVQPLTASRAGSTWCTSTAKALGLANVADCLSEAELQHADRLRHAEDRDRYLAARILLRHALSHAVQGRISPTQWRFQLEPGGKPVMAPGWPSIAFNLSHCGDCVAVAVSSSGPIGIDLEMLEPDSRLQIVEEALTEDEREQFRRMPESERWATFIQLWTVKEARAKALGRGPALDFRSPAAARNGRAAGAPRAMVEASGEIHISSTTIHSDGRAYCLSTATLKA